MQAAERKTHYIRVKQCLCQVKNNAPNHFQARHFQRTLLVHHGIAVAHAAMLFLRS